MQNVLNKIIFDKKQWLKDFDFSKYDFANLTSSSRDFYQALKQKPAFILECKKASPSKGLIRKDFDLSAIAKIYQKYASVISVLTDEKYFQGSFDYLKQVEKLVDKPLLCKDFIIDEKQILLARLFGADAVLLMLSVLDDEQYLALKTKANQLNMGVLTETSNQAEIIRAINLGAKVIGINNRDLRDLSVDINKTAVLVDFIRQNFTDYQGLIISESGINNNQDIWRLTDFADGFLVGSSLMKQVDLEDAVRGLVLSDKVCGLTNSFDAQNAYQLGALYGGLIFADNSIRKIDIDKAKEIVKSSPLRYVGVFQNQSIDYVVDVAKQLNLFAIQLHGFEDDQYIKNLKNQLPASIQIWRAVFVGDDDFCANDLIDCYVLDNKKGEKLGGTGTTFDWQKIPSTIKCKSLLAGGINPDNCVSARTQGVLGLDINSGVEKAPRVKDINKLSLVLKRG